MGTDKEMTTPATPKKMRKHLTLLTLLGVGMFGFCFALVPLYSVFCKATGLNGKTSGIVETLSTGVDTSRTITVVLLATLNESLPDAQNEFSTEVRKYTVHPGEYINTTFWVKNLSDKPKVVQAIPSVSPGLVAKHVKKMECFCFKHQPLLANEGKEMPLVFAVDPKLPLDIKTVTLAYTLFDVTQN